LYDFQIKKIANSGGVVGVPFYSYFLNGANKTEIADIIHHLERLINIGGENVAAIGTDFDGMNCNLPFKNAGDMQLLVDAIIKKFGLKIAEKICYKNALRILE
jgi:membrane dipeptidase